ncbi:MAG: hypothetical protein MZV65_28540 [Chromatiales bacterium]|nr:hypothetical protein [Chromatiales bacterium]
MSRHVARPGLLAPVPVAEIALEHTTGVILDLGQAQPVRLDVRAIHDRAHIARGLLEDRFKVREHDLDRQPAQARGHFEHQMHQDAGVLAAGEADVEIGVPEDGLLDARQGGVVDIHRGISSTKRV